MPLGMAGDCPRLRCRIFVNWKARARSRFDRLNIDQDGDATVQKSVAMTLDAWKSIGQDHKPINFTKPATKIAIILSTSLEIHAAIQAIHSPISFDELLFFSP
jgi:hypothetical protein